MPPQGVDIEMVVLLGRVLEEKIMEISDVLMPSVISMVTGTIRMNEDTGRLCISRVFIANGKNNCSEMNPRGADLVSLAGRK